MTQPTNPAGPYQMPTAAPSAAPSGRSVSAAGYWIGGGILVIGFGIAIIWFVVTIVGLVDAPNDFDRIAIPGSEVVTLDDGDWVFYWETDANRFSTNVPPSVDVTGPSGREISVGYPSGSYTYDLDGNQGEALYEFRAPTAGAYTIEVGTVGETGLRSTDRIAIGRPLFDSSQIAGILGSLALGAVAFLAGLVILIVTIVRRGRAKRRPAMAYGGPQPYGGPQYGRPQYGGPQYGGPQQGAAPGYPPTPGSWPPPQAPGWGAPPSGPQPPPAGPGDPPPPWGAPSAPSSPSAEPPPPAAPSPWTPPGTPRDTGADEPGDDTAPG